ncbi:MAG: hypothetical protein U0984_13065 [Prosthecobacter sp.]|nr:hypothetical protein [Prosthecobacter sp.]
MKTTILCLLGLLGLNQVSQASILGIYDFNNLPNASSPNNASWVSPCIELCPLGPCDCLNQGLVTSGGPDGSAFRTFSGWDKTQYDPSVYFDRADVYQWPKTVAFEAHAADDSLGFISGLSVDVQRQDSNSPDTLMASIFWKDDLGAVQFRSSGPVSLGSVGSWDTIDFDFVNGTADLPSGAEYSGEDFLFELYAWGGDGGQLNLDNVTVMGQCAPIPEPGGALLVACAGFVLMLRRRRR